MGETKKEENLTILFRFIAVIVSFFLVSVQIKYINLLNIFNEKPDYQSTFVEKWNRKRHKEVKPRETADSDDSDSQSIVNHEANSSESSAWIYLFDSILLFSLLFPSQWNGNWLQNIKWFFLFSFHFHSNEHDHIFFCFAIVFSQLLFVVKDVCLTTPDDKEETDFRKIKFKKIKWWKHFFLNWVSLSPPEYFVAFLCLSISEFAHLFWLVSFQSLFQIDYISLTDD